MRGGGGREERRWDWEMIREEERRDNIREAREVKEKKREDGYGADYTAKYYKYFTL